MTEISAVGDSGFFGAFEETIGEFFVVAGNGNEKTTGSFNGVGVDTSKDGILFGTFGGRVRIGDDVPSSGMQETVVTACGSLTEIDALDKDSFQSAHCRITKNTDSGSSSADDDDVAG